MHFAGVYKICSRDHAQQLLDTGKWYDKTIYHTDEEKKNGLRIKREEPKYEQVNTASRKDANTINSKKDGNSLDEKQKKDEVINAESSEIPRPKKRRGRPPKIKVSDNAANTQNSK